MRLRGGVDVDYRLDGVAATPVSAAAVTALNLSQEIDLGAIDASGTPLQFSNANIKEVVVTRIAPTDADMVRAIRYLGMRNSIAVTT